MNLKNKRILITAGPTWVPLDSVRVISNRATGETGILLSEKFSKLGAKVTLVLGPITHGKFNKKVKIIGFKFFEELRAVLRKELNSRTYDCIIHSAAVSDFRPAHSLKGKLSSDKPYNLKLVKLPKIACDIRRLAPLAQLILFKLETGVSDVELLLRARNTLVKHGAGLIVANKTAPAYKAYILDKDKIYSRLNSKKDMVKNLVALVKEGLLWK